MRLAIELAFFLTIPAIAFSEDLSGVVHEAFYSKESKLYCYTLSAKTTREVKLEGLPPTGVQPDDWNLVSISASANRKHLAVGYISGSSPIIGLFNSDTGNRLASLSSKELAFGGSIFFSPDSASILASATSKQGAKDKTGSWSPALLEGKSYKPNIFALPNKHGGRFGWDVAGWISQTEFVAVAKNLQICNVSTGKARSMPATDFFRSKEKTGSNLLQPILFSFDIHSSATIAVGVPQSQAQEAAFVSNLLIRKVGSADSWREFACLAGEVTAIAALPGADSVLICFGPSREGAKIGLYSVFVGNGEMQLLVDDVEPGILAPMSAIPGK